MIMHILLTAATTYVVTLLILTTLPKLALWIGLTDAPSARKLHAGSVPLIGGIAMFCGFILGACLLPLVWQEFYALFVASGLLVFIGVLDDWHELSPQARLLGQLLAALLIVFWGENVLTCFGDLWGSGNIVFSGGPAYAVTILAVMSIINALNMLDGLDGLAAVSSLFTLLAMAVFAWQRHNFLVLSVILLVCVAICAFLPFNWRFKKSAKVFMGDAGSTFLGLVLVWFAIYSTQHATPLARPVSMLWILALPICELLTLFVYRLLQRRSPFTAARDHLHHLLMQLGWPQWQVVLILLIAGSIFASIGILGEWRQWPESGMFFGFIGLLCGHAALQSWLRKRIGKIAL